MTPHRASNGRGTYLLDRVVAGVGRIQRASGTEKISEWRAINSLVTELVVAMRQRQDATARAVLRALHAGEIQGVVVLRAHREGTLDALVQIPGATTPTSAISAAERRASEPIAPRWAAFVAATTNKRTRRERDGAWRRLATVLPADPAVRDLPDAVLQVREDLAAHPPMFNRVRAAAMAFTRKELTKVHPVYLAIAAVEALAESPAEREAPSVVTAITIRDALPAKAAVMWWSMYLTGMGPDEYDLAWRHADGGIEIPGTKRRARARIVPQLGPVVRRTMGWKQYRAALAALPHDVQPYDARRGFSRLVEHTPGVTTSRWKRYMGHALDVTENYARARQVEAVQEDGPRIAAVLAAAEGQVRQARKRGMLSA